MSEKDEVQAELTTGDVEKQIETEQPEVSEAKSVDAGVDEAEATEANTEQEGADGEDTEAAQQAQAEREKAIQAYQQALVERNALLTKSHLVQNKLADYFKRKKSDDQKDEIAKDNTSELEMKYMKLIQSIDAMIVDLANQKEDFETQIKEMNTKKKTRQDQVNSEWESLLARKREVSVNCVFARSGKTISSKEVDQMEDTERKKEEELCQARLENIRQKNKLKKREQALKQKEELAEGLHLIDFEQLKIENQTYNEKIEERNEDLLKFKNKIQSTVQVLTHLKEKLEFVSTQNGDLTAQLEEIEREATSKRDKLAKTKLARDRLRSENIKLQQNMGLLGKMDLLCDFETQIETSEKMESKLVQLKAQHAELKKENQIYKQKIDKHKRAKDDVIQY